ncbi:MAG: hypothetical protein WBW33_34285 [Bryobacteraceae bacterium]
MQNNAGPIQFFAPQGTAPKTLELHWFVLDINRSEDSPTSRHFKADQWRFLVLKLL